MSQSRSPVTVLWGLLALWIGIELFYSSRWLNFAASDQQPTRHLRTRDALRDMLSRPAGKPVTRVWFAPYTTFPETGAIESRMRSGVYDTFKAFPRNGLITNYGAFKLSPADSLFAQISSDGIAAEAELAKQLGYTKLALDLGSIVDAEVAIKLCKYTTGCKISGDGYALFPLSAKDGGPIKSLASVRRSIALLPQQSAAFRWNGLVFQPGHWWLPGPESLMDSSGFLSVRAKPIWTTALYRFNPIGVAPAARQILAPKDLSVKAALGQGLAGVDLCIGKKDSPYFDATCRKVQLRKGAAAVDITELLTTGSVTEIKVEHLYNSSGLPARMDELPTVTSGEGYQQASPFSLDIAPHRPR